MSETQGAGAPSASSPAPNGGGDLHPAFNNPVSRPANPPPDYDHPAENPRTRGHSPAMDYRQRVAQQQQSPASDAGGSQQHTAAPGAGEQQQTGQQEQPSAAPSTVRIGDAEFAHQDVLDALKAKAEADIRRRGLPQSPADYQLKLPRLRV